MSAYISQHLTFRSISNVQHHRLHQTWSAVLSHTCRNAALYYLPGRLSTWTLLSTTPLPSIQILFLWPPWHLHREAKHL
ncbi:hypothetical protein CNE00010 [Cryptococcus deneoformans JEC21]|uniref:Uncharacterized protein n=1 Tax=Cryptococcus deneoformans (strain JEC21 / ATCC MYA-565) TaxID=214684 RepID=Q5KHH8_CRYD1|nr:hypothetical protein CNE00010 [Cryptococcus neoformans var. neoformans JEC21]AAW43818.2 hypothetical protein CNE00010 [Cryptococcus neoformans var. neoformans JEC21]